MPPSYSPGLLSQVYSPPELRYWPKSATRWGKIGHLVVGGESWAKDPRCSDRPPRTATADAKRQAGDGAAIHAGHTGDGADAGLHRPLTILIRRKPNADSTNR